jgi:hypothetical protein
MALRPLLMPLSPELDLFLFAAVGEEQNGMSLSVISALTRLGLDPREEAGRLAALTKRDAIDRLTALMLRLPGMSWPPSGMQQIAMALVEARPTRGETSRRVEGQFPEQQKIASGRTFWLICLLVVSVALLLAITQGGLPFGQQPPSAAATR